MAALLHDVIEDQDVKKEELLERFGPQVANLVDGLSKLEKIEFQSEVEAQAENFRKMLLAMASRRARHPDQAGRPPAQHAHAGRDGAGQEAPHRPRDDGSLRADRAPARPERHLPRAAGPVVLAPVPAALPHAVARRSRRRAATAAKWSRRSSTRSRPRWPRAGIQAEVYGREKTLFGIYKKMRNKHLSFSQVLDVYGFRVVVDTRRRTVTWRSAPCMRCTSRCPASSRTTSRSARSTATSRCTPR